MSHDAGASLTEIALACGFSGSSDFSRSFRAHYGVPPRVFDVAVYRKTGRDRMLESLALERLPSGQNPDGFDRAGSARRAAARGVPA